MISLHETVKFKCEIKIKVYTQQKNTVKKIHLGLECDDIMIGDIYMYLTRIFRRWDNTRSTLCRDKYISWTASIEWFSVECGWYHKWSVYNNAHQCLFSTAVVYSVEIHLKYHKHTVKFLLAMLLFYYVVY